MPFVIYADLEFLIKKFDGCKSNPEKSFARKVGEHTPSCFSISTISSFKEIEKRMMYTRGKDCMKKLCETYREDAITIIIVQNKKKQVVNKRTATIIRKDKNLLFFKKRLKISILTMKKFAKLGTIVIIQVNTVVLHTAYVI